jgi:hypothetical protein
MVNPETQVVFTPRKAGLASGVSPTVLAPLPRQPAS